MTRPVHPLLVVLAACAVSAGCGQSSTVQEPASAGARPTRSASSSPTVSMSASRLSPSPAGSASEEPVLTTPSPDVSFPASAPDLAPVVHRVETHDPVVFITIDDGYHKDPDVVALLKARHVPVTPFLAVNALSAHHEYFTEVEKVTGQSVQNHTLAHPYLSRLPYDEQRHEICGAADQLGEWYGTRPWLFRPPYGDYSRTTRRAAKDCGMTALVLWDVSMPHDVLRFGSGTTFQPGDILLVHWRPHLARDLPVALDAIKAAGLHPAALQDYLPRPSSG